MTATWERPDLLGDQYEAEYRNDPGDLIDAAGFILDLLQRPSWMADAACREHPEVNFFPDRGEDPAPVLRVCSTCLVREECRTWAVDHDELGIWGATSERARRQIRGGTDPSTLAAGTATYLARRDAAAKAAEARSAEALRERKRREKRLYRSRTPEQRATDAAAREAEIAARRRRILELWDRGDAIMAIGREMRLSPVSVSKHIDRARPGERLARNERRNAQRSV